MSFSTIHQDPRFGFLALPNPAIPVSSRSGKLAGMRLAVKDLFHISGLPTGAGNPQWLATHDIPFDTHEVVEHMLSEGSVFVGKTMTDELAYSLNGQNKHYGTPQNPIAPNRLPGGSSSGSAVAVAANKADIGLGTDTGGSIRVPASYNGLYGLRPTHNRLSVEKMVGLAPSFDTVGWLTRHIEDMEAVADCLLQDGLVNVQNLKLGILTNFVELASHQPSINAWAEQHGAIALTLPNNLVKHLSESFRVLQGYEIWKTHGRWIDKHQPDFATDIRQRLDSCKNITQEQITQATVVQKQLVSAVNKLFEHIDVLVIPTTPGIAPLLSTPESELADYRVKLLTMTSVASLTGLPQLHVPLFVQNDAPCGISLIGLKHSDRQLIQLAKKLGK
jgi:Asp-tRNA(Asn)/Glu-tRNA(Gln) amidotransferase A subunit family amidase